MIKIVKIDINKPEEVLMQKEIPTQIKMDILCSPILSKETRTFFYFMSIIEIYYNLKPILGITEDNKELKKLIDYIEGRSFFYTEKSDIETSLEFQKFSKQIFSDAFAYFENNKEQMNKDNIHHYINTALSAGLCADTDGTATSYGVFQAAFSSLCVLVDTIFKDNYDIMETLKDALNMSIYSPIEIAESMEDLANESKGILH